MDEKDRHLVTFENGFSYDEDIPELTTEPVAPVAPSTSGTVSSSSTGTHTDPSPAAPISTPTSGTVPASVTETHTDTSPETPASPETRPLTPTSVIRQDGQETPTRPSAPVIRLDGPQTTSETTAAHDRETHSAPLSGTVPASATGTHSEPRPVTPASSETRPVTPIPVIRQDAPETPTRPATPASSESRPVTPTPVIRQDGPQADADIPAAHDRRTYSAPAHAKTAEKAAKEKKYVTKGVLVAFMIATMIISALLGAVAGAAFSNMKNPARAERNDSKLSQLNLSDATGSELTVAEIVAKNENSVVEIVVSGTTENIWGQLQLTQGAGSGVIVRKDGYIATNYHVIEGANKVEVTLHDGTVYDAKIIGADPDNDIAVIKVDAKDLTPAVIGDSSNVAVGDLAVAIGNPLGQLGGTATSGIISALDRTLTIEGTTLTLLQTDAAINGGNSGGGLFNGRGELIGIVESKASAVGVEGLAFALPINSISEIINNMIETGASPEKKATPAVGIVISDVSEDNAQYYGLEEAGVYVAQVTGENARQAGFQEKDRIVSLDGKEIKDSATFISLVRKHNVGDTVTIVISRNGQEMEIKTVLEELQSEG